MHRFWITLIYAALAASTCSTCLWGQLLLKPQVLDGFAASVNGNLITITEVQGRAMRLNAGIPKGLPPEQRKRALQQNFVNALNSLINDKLIVAEFESKGGSIPEQAIKNQMEVVINRRFNGDQSALLQALEQQQQTLDSFKMEVRDSIIVASMRNEALPLLAIPPAQVRAAYEKNKEQYRIDGGVRFSMLILKGAGKDAAEVRRNAAEIRNEAIAGKDFASLVRTRSDDSDRENGGDQGFQKEADLNATFREVMGRLRIKEVSHPIELNGDIYLLQLTERRDAGLIPLAKVQPDIEKKLLLAEELKLEESWLSRLRKKHSVVVYR